MDRLDALQVLLAVVDSGSLSGASRKLNASLPSISRKVGDLEQRLGTRLLVRTSRNVQLTDAGRDYVDTIRAIVADLDEADRRASGEYHAPRGELTVTVPGEFGRLVAVPLIYEFLEQHPEISVRILALERVVDLIEERVDVGVRLGPLTDSPLYAVKVGDAALATCASPEYLARKGTPLHPSELVAHDGISFGGLNSLAWSYSVDGQPFAASPQFRVNANTASACLEAAARGFGIARLFDFHVDSELRSGALVPVLGEFETVSLPVHLVYAKQGMLPLKVRAFLDWMTPRLRQRLKEIGRICDAERRAG